MSRKKLLVLGASGMLGHAVLRWFMQRPEYEVVGTVRTPEAAVVLRRYWPQACLVDHLDFSQTGALRRLFSELQPELVINCVGVVKQLAGAGEPATAIPVNAMLPHRLSRLCQAHGARLVHISTDCVFSGRRGQYSEDDVADAEDLYGRSKLMGEVLAPHAITLRTSIIGHELGTAHALLGWFLSQQGVVPGYDQAIFSALPTIELARVIEQYVLPNPELHGVYHVAGPTINKYELLKLVAQVYRTDNQVSAVSSLAVDRSLDGRRFQAMTGYQPPDWPTLVESMRAFG